MKQSETKENPIDTPLDEGIEDGQQISEDDKSQWPRYREFTLANYERMARQSLETPSARRQTMKYFNAKAERMRSIFDKAFEKVTGKRVDGAGNWIVSITLIISSVLILSMHRNANDRYRIQIDDVLIHRDNLKAEIEQLKEDIDKFKEKTN